MSQTQGEEHMTPRTRDDLGAGERVFEMTDGVLLYHDCPNCKRYQLSASMWRNEAYKHAGTPLPWEPEELLRKEYERGYADAMNWKLQNHLEHLPSGLEAAVKAEREACAKLCEEPGWNAANWCAKQIRARGETK